MPYLVLAAAALRRLARVVRPLRSGVLLRLMLLPLFALPVAAAAQAKDPTAVALASTDNGARVGQNALDSLVARAIAVNPTITAARARAEAARHSVSATSAPPDPMLMAGVLNQPLGRTPATISPHGVATTPSGPDPMTMHMIGVEQTIPYRGKLSLRRQAAERDAEASRAAVDATAQQVIRDVKNAYYELAFIDQALSIVGRNRDVLAGLIKVTDVRYGVGTAGQEDVLKARVEATKLAETAVTLSERRRAAVAQLNALLERASDTPLEHADVPLTIARAAVPASASQIRFVSVALGARAADSPIPALAELQQTAIHASPAIAEHEAMIAAQTARLELARKASLPDFDVSLQYGQRSGGLPDMVSATVSVPLPVFKGRKQDQLVAEAGAQLAALHAEHQAKVDQINADVARLVSELERSRTQLALYVKALLPEARATLSSATASYQVGKVEFITVLDDQATVFNYETEYFRALSDFAKNLAELERVVGKEIVQ